MHRLHSIRADLKSNNPNWFFLNKWKWFFFSPNVENVSFISSADGRPLEFPILDGVIGYKLLFYQIIIPLNVSPAIEIRVLAVSNKYIYTHTHVYILIQYTTHTIQTVNLTNSFNNGNHNGINSSSSMNEMIDSKIWLTISLN